MIRTARAGGFTIVAAPCPEIYGVDLTFICPCTEGNSGTWNIPLLISDIPDFVEAIAEVLGAVFEQHGEDINEDDEDRETCNGMGEKILEEVE